MKTHFGLDVSQPAPSNRLLELPSAWGDWLILCLLTWPQVGTAVARSLHFHRQESMTFFKRTEPSQTRFLSIHSNPNHHIGCEIRQQDPAGVYKHIWRFPIYGGTPINHPFVRWDFPWNKPSSYFGVAPWLWKPPIQTTSATSAMKWLTISPEAPPVMESGTSINAFNDH